MGMALLLGETGVWTIVLYSSLDPSGNIQDLTG